jgi:hypothetical protein
VQAAHRQLVGPEVDDRVAAAARRIFQTLNAFRACTE